MRMVLFNDLLLLQLMSCDYVLLPDRIGLKNLSKTLLQQTVLSDVLCKDQMRLMVEEIGAWIRFPETQHEFLAHLAEMIGKTFTE